MCPTLPTGAGRANLREIAAGFAGAACGKYEITCEGVDPARAWVLLVGSGEAGTVLSFSGERGDGFNAENVQEYVAAGFRAAMLAFDNGPGGAALCARAGCPPAATGDPGPKEAACRIRELVDYFDALEEGALCAQGNSAGSSALAYALAHHGAGDALRYVQLAAWTPFAAPAQGCLPSGNGKRSYSGINPSGQLQTVNGRPYAYDDGQRFVSPLVEALFGLHDGACDRGTPTASELARLEAEGIVSTGAVWTYPTTVIDAYACTDSRSIVDGVGSWWLEQVQAGNPGRVFMQALAPGIGFNKACTGEQIWRRSNGDPSPIRQLTIDRMAGQCR